MKLFSMFALILLLAAPIVPAQDVVKGGRWGASPGNYFGALAESGVIVPLATPYLGQTYTNGVDRTTGNIDILGADSLFIHFDFSDSVDIDSINFTQIPYGGAPRGQTVYGITSAKVATAAAFWRRGIALRVDQFHPWIYCTIYFGDTGNPTGANIVLQKYRMWFELKQRAM